MEPTSQTEGKKNIRIDLDSGSGYSITFDGVDRLPDHMEAAGLRAGSCFIVTDGQVADLYAARLEKSLRVAGWRPVVITLPPGETTKSLPYLQQIYDNALSRGVERNTPLIALGGGVVGDLAGFAAATLLRGIPLIQVPTTLIAQVDSAIGGKTGINHESGKNLIGAFYHPAVLLVDTSLLRSLPAREWTSGLAEVVKAALIADEELFRTLEERWTDVLDRDPVLVDDLVARAAAVKASVVSQDEREAGLRAILNFGHTFAHAIENVSGYGTFTHGEAVAMGMRAALHLSRARAGGLNFERADALVARLPVPPGLSDLDVGDLNRAMRSDKKVRQGTIRFVLLDRIGKAYVTDDVEPSSVTAAWRHAQGLI